MARTNIPVVTIPQNGGISKGAVTAGDATNDHSFVNDERTRLEVKNTDAGAQSVTIVTSYTVAGLAVADVVQSIPTGETWEFGPFPRSLYGQPSDLDKVWVDISVANFEFRAITTA